MRAGKWLTVLSLSFISLLFLFPFYLMIVMGTYYSEDLFKKLPLLPSGYFVENMKTILSANILHNYWNSFYVAVLFTFVTVGVAAITGFAFGKYEFAGKKYLYGFILLTMMIPGQLGLIAYVMEMKWFHLNNTHAPLILAGLNNAFGVFFMTQFARSSVPAEVVESARIDGCSEPGLFVRIVVPFLLPAISTLGLISFLGSWNNYLLPLVTINKPDLYTMPLGIANLSTVFRTDYSASILGLTLGTLPLIVLFLFGSKTLVQGLTGGAVKG
ncbi:multiple sugar transport system permease protein/cellobiose transport system permease protein [Paenibacillus catalpae]|uniref:Multiple sugar transport system permease protein/cellobiose transport system permease protein n=1 Tax=Paenibacillus catalpae TaxID=1045775 RepID=A0A1I2BB89_9BACL|nr:carbohydrate ABC transporter permease [Paenibacillus catalpae]SFE53356.1 multiple sugar transport system permease protein/cellobiose transport system permease protein [Paenibacillus catalpae]